MKNVILIAGGTGDLGQRIVKFLRKTDAEVRVVSRKGSNTEISEKLRKLGAKLFKFITGTKRNFLKPAQV